MDLGSIEREIYVDASPETVFEVVSCPSHVKQWWTDDADYEVAAGSEGEIVFGQRGADANVCQFVVVDVQPPRLFSFRWTHPVGEPAAAGNSMLVTFDLSPAGDGTLLRMTETGFREMGWELAKLQHEYESHARGWDLFMPRIPEYVAGLAVDA
jgi:uncharacterized protein YndB with AHSA1/START domain